MPTSSSPKPRKPLPPVFVNERARLAEFKSMYKAARIRWKGYPVCPDCFNPPHLCAHMNLRRNP